MTATSTLIHTPQDENVSNPRRRQFRRGMALQAALLSTSAVAIGLVTWLGMKPAGKTTPGPTQTSSMQATPKQALGEARIESVVELDAGVYHAVDRFRNETGLAASDLAAMDLTGEQAQAVLEQVLAEVSSNRTSWDQARSQRNAADHELRLGTRAVRLGLDNAPNAREITLLRETLEARKASYQDLLDAAADRVLLGAPAQARQRISQARENSNRRGYERYLGQSTLGRVDLDAAYQHELTSLRAAAAQRMPAILVAERQVLGLSPEEQDHTDDMLNSGAASSRH